MPAEEGAQATVGHMEIRVMLLLPKGAGPPESSSAFEHPSDFGHALFKVFEVFEDIDRTNNVKEAILVV